MFLARVDVVECVVCTPQVKVILGKCLLVFLKQDKGCILLSNSESLQLLMWNDCAYSTQYYVFLKEAKCDRNTVTAECLAK
ncbi:hypothetical protein DSO57_1012958 [Entomophthora muscae]|uniref:Uncharacterized protein n=1 Tax=Entomophthora muscae TaxID=34485 RepID=A0ACC2TGS5_9FUNG|nr:hypothetical protein DSO57_1012958 [Entomophthora muscae]